MSSWRPILRLVWAELHQNGRQLLLVMLSFAIGIAVLVSLISLREALNIALESEAKALLGADLLLSSSQPLTAELLQEVSAAGASVSRELSFSSMLLDPKSGNSRLVQVRALAGDYPFYGEVVADPAAEFDAVRGQRNGLALLDESLVTQLQVKLGDSIKLGALTLVFKGVVRKFPGASYARMMVTPSIYVALDDAQATGLLMKGSRVNYKYHLQLSEPLRLKELEARLISLKFKQRFEIETVESRKKSVGRTLDNVGRYLQLLGFVALLLGAIGMGSAVNAYIVRRLPQAANLRCLGFDVRQVVTIYAVQCIIVAFVAALAGVAGSFFLNSLLLESFREFLPVGGVKTAALSLKAIGYGSIGGVLLALGFSAFSLLRVQAVTPLEALRASTGIGTVSNSAKAVVSLLLLAIIALLSVLTSESLPVGLGFIGGFSLLALVLHGLGTVALRLLKRGRAYFRSLVLRQGIAGLFRPNSQTPVLILTIGLGTLLVVMISLVRAMLVEQVSFAGTGDRPNLIFFDVQSDQLQGVTEKLSARGLPILQEVPIVTMRLVAINGSTNEQLRADVEIPEWTLRREYRSTYRDQLIESEELLKGRWWSPGKLEGIIPVSIEEGIATDLKVSLGDRVTFDLQGVPLETEVVSIRRVDWRRIQTNFFFVFPTGILEEAPQFFAVTTRASSNKLSAEIQREFVNDFPNVSAIDLNLILETVDDILDKAAAVIQFLAFFTLLAGFIVLAGAVATTRAARLGETLLMRTLGATRREVLLMSLVEFLLIGILSVGIGVLLASFASWALARYFFQVDYLPELVAIVGIGGSVVFVVVLAGALTAWQLSKVVPIAVLRSEVG